MRPFVSSAGRLVFCLLFVPLVTQASNRYVAPYGVPSGPGTLGHPYDLATAISGQVGQPGDTFWLAGGTYTIGHVDTKIEGAPGQPITFRPMPGERARVDGSLTFFNSSGYVILQDLEFFSSDTNRVSAQTGAGFNPTDINPLTGISSFAPNLSFINLIVHDETKEGIYLSQESSNNLIYGCVIYNNGWRSPDNAEGHGIYVQANNGFREVANNIVFNNSGVGLHIYENDPGFFLADVTLDGNVAFNAGAIQSVRSYLDWIVGADPPGVNADQIVFENNLGYLPLTPDTDDPAQLGREGTNGTVTVLNNYLPAGLEVNNWSNAIVSGNTLSAQSTNYVVTLNQMLTPLTADWNSNNYAVPVTSSGFLDNTNTLDFYGWQTATGYDSNSTFATGTLTGTRVFIETNRFEAGRANIIVYNWDNLTNVPVDVSSVLARGAAYEVRNAEDFYAPPVLTGMFNGQPLDLPMTGLSVAAPNGPMLTPPPTGPTFNVFVLLPRTVRLQIQATNNEAQLFWPTDAGDWVLQFAASQSNYWIDVTNFGAFSVVKDYYEVDFPFLGDTGFFRLRAVP